MRDDLQSTITPERLSLLRRLGAAGFVFFLVKGILWLAVPFLLVWFGSD